MNKILSAGVDLLRGDFSGAVKSLITADVFPLNISPNTYRSMPDNGQWFWEQNGSGIFHFKYSGHTSSLNAYEICPPINAIINRKAQAYINGKTWVLNTRGKEATSEAANKLKKLIEKPNALQTWKQFEAQGYIYQQLFGFNIVLVIKPAGFKDNIDASSLWNIPPSMIDIEETNKLFYQTNTQGILKKIVLNYKNTRTELSLNDIYFFKDFTPSFDSLIIPQSRICSLGLPINNIIGCYESRNVLINYRGALGILTNEAGSGQFQSLPISKTEKESLQGDLRRYGLKNNQWQFIITSASLKWQQMGVSTKDLMLFEEIEDDIRRICDGYNYPYQLMSSATGTTFSNVDAAKKLLYQDSIIPEAESMYEQWNAMFNLNELNIRLDKDFSHVAVLQDDEVQKMTARKTRDDAYSIEWDKGLITRNQWRIANGEDPKPGDDLLISELDTNETPLAVTIGVGGVQGLIAILTAQGLTQEARQATLEIVFGLTSSDASRMAASGQNSINETANQPTA